MCPINMYRMSINRDIQRHMTRETKFNGLCPIYLLKLNTDEYYNYTPY